MHLLFMPELNTLRNYLVLLTHPAGAGWGVL